MFDDLAAYFYENVVVAYQDKHNLSCHEIPSYALFNRYCFLSV